MNKYPNEWIYHNKWLLFIISLTRLKTPLTKIVLGYAQYLPYGQRPPFAELDLTRMQYRDPFGQIGPLVGPLSLVLPCCRSCSYAPVRAGRVVRLCIRAMVSSRVESGQLRCAQLNPDSHLSSVPVYLVIDANQKKPDPSVSIRQRESAASCRRNRWTTSRTVRVPLRTVLWCNPLLPCICETTSRTVVHRRRLRTPAPSVAVRSQRQRSRRSLAIVRAFVGTDICTLIDERFGWLCALRTTITLDSMKNVRNSKISEWTSRWSI